MVHEMKTLLFIPYSLLKKRIKSDNLGLGVFSSLTFTGPAEYVCRLS